LTLRVMWFFMVSLIYPIQTSTFSSLSHLVPRHQALCLLFSNVWFISAKSLLILLQITIKTHMSPCVFHKHTLETYIYVVCIHRYFGCIFMSWTCVNDDDRHAAWMFNLPMFIITLVIWHSRCTNDVSIHNACLDKLILLIRLQNIFLLHM
jgi:hypothetical protein